MSASKPQRIPLTITVCYGADCIKYVWMGYQYEAVKK